MSNLPASTEPEAHKRCDFCGKTGVLVHTSSLAAASICGTCAGDARDELTEAEEAHKELARASLPPQRSEFRFGRRLVIALWSALLLYVAVVGFSSVGPATYSPAILGRPTPATSCHRALGGAYAQIRDLRIRLADNVLSSPQAWPDALAPSRRELLALRPRCGDTPGYDELERLVFALGVQGRRIQAEEAPLWLEMDRRFGADHSHPNPPSWPSP